MKNILKSVVTISALAVMLSTATGAYFTSNVAAEDNVIETGTLLLAVDTAQEDTYEGTWGTPNAFNVVRQLVDGTVDQRENFITWSNAAPGDDNTYTVAVRNRGTIPFKFRAGATGDWESTPAFNAACVTAHGAPDASLVEVTDIYQYATTPTGGCEGDIGCRNLRDGLVGLGGWSPVSGLSAGGSGSVSGFYYGVDEGTGSSGGTATLIGEDEFAIYQVQVTLSDTADSCYQGATYHFDLGVEATQDAATF